MGENSLLSEFGELSFEEWNDKIVFRGVAHKTDDALAKLEAMYLEKIPRLERLTFPTDPEMTAEENEAHLMEFVASKLAKIGRLKEKLACVLKEQKFRQAELVTRKTHGTTYYIDLDNGDDAKDGLTTGNAWKTIDKYTTTTVRSAGDIAKVRANTSQVITAHVEFDEDGDSDNYIEVHGCSSTDDPWGDGSDVKPIIDANSAALYLNCIDDSFWRFYRLDLKGGTSSEGMFRLYYGMGTIIENCDIHDNADRGLYSAYIYYEVKGCNFYSNSGYSLYTVYCRIKLDSCVFNGGVGTTDYGIQVYSSFVEIIDSTFGATTLHDVGSIKIHTRRWGVVRARNCLFSDALEVYFQSTCIGGAVYSEDHDQVSGAQKTFLYTGIILRDSAIQLDGEDSWKVSPNSDCNATWALTLRDDPMIGDWQFWLPASQKTISIKARETAAWTVDPTSSEFYIEVSYLNHATQATRATQASSQSLSGVSEVTFTATVTPSQAGWAHVRVYLKKYESGKSIQVSAVPSVS